MSNNILSIVTFHFVFVVKVYLFEQSPDFQKLYFKTNTVNCPFLHCALICRIDEDNKFPDIPDLKDIKRMKRFQSRDLGVIQGGEVEQQSFYNNFYS